MKGHSPQQHPIAPHSPTERSPIWGMDCILKDGTHPCGVRSPSWASAEHYIGHHSVRCCSSFEVESLSSLSSTNTVLAGLSCTLSLFRGLGLRRDTGYRSWRGRVLSHKKGLCIFQTIPCVSMHGYPGFYEVTWWWEKPQVNELNTKEE